LYESIAFTSGISNNNFNLAMKLSGSVLVQVTSSASFLLYVGLINLQDWLLPLNAELQPLHIISLSPVASQHLSFGQFRVQSVVQHSDHLPL